MIFDRSKCPCKLLMSLYFNCDATSIMYDFDRLKMD